MKINDLTNDQLNYWVAKAQGWEWEGGTCAFGDHWQLENPKVSGKNIFGTPLGVRVWGYQPTIDYAQCFVLIERFNLDITKFKGKWHVNRSQDYPPFIDMSWHKSLSRAICCAVVSSVYGNEVST